MSRYVAFLRGINLGRRRPPMAELKRLFEQLGFAEVATFIASGNVIFTASGRDEAKLEAQIERQLAAGLGYEVDTFVRRTDEVAAVLLTGLQIGPAPVGGSVHVGFLKAPLGAAQRRQLAVCRTDVDQFSVEGREFYWRCGVGTAESKIWASAAMKAVKLPTFTMRNRTSLQKLAAKIGLPETVEGNA